MTVRKAVASRRGARRAVGGRRLLVVSVGNTNTTVAWFEGDAIVASWIHPTESGSAAAIVEALAVRVAARARARTGAALCSVVPARSREWRVALAARFGGRVREVGPASDRRLLARYPDRLGLGPDRIANAIGARARHGAPAIVVDLGTATTFDCIDRAGRFAGGAIAPGIGTASEALFGRAARIPPTVIRRPHTALGRNTAEAVRSGVMWTAAGGVDALVRRLAAEMGEEPRVIATGGWAEQMAGLCDTFDVIDPALTLHGTRLAWEEMA